METLEILNISLYTISIHFIEKVNSNYSLLNLFVTYYHFLIILNNFESFTKHIRYIIKYIKLKSNYSVIKSYKLILICYILFNVFSQYFHCLYCKNEVDYE